MKKPPTRSRKANAEQARLESDRLIQQIMTERSKAMERAVDFSLLYGAPEWVVRLILPDMQVLLGKPESTWRPSEIKQLQESVDTLPLRLLAAACSPAPEI